MVVVRNLSKRYANGKSALEDVSFTIGDGRVVLLLGRNGAGKTSLIHIACQVIRATSGSVDLGITHGRELGWCSQSQMIDWWLSVLDNVCYGPGMAGFSVGEARRRASEALELVGLQGEAARNCSELSGGQLQRVQVARVIAARPSVMFLDEPTVGLDAWTTLSLMEDIRRRADDGAIVIVSSHELDSVEEYCDEVLLLDKGRLVSHASADEFTRTWSDKERVFIEFEGRLPASFLHRVQGLLSGAELVGSGKPTSRSGVVQGQVHDGSESDVSSPIDVLLPAGKSLLLLKELVSVVSVTQFRVDRPTLADAFLSFQRTVHGREVAG